MKKTNLYLDMHVLQTAPPSCINRDDTGSPKIAMYGGTTRARVSSQAWKKAMRDMFRDEIFDENLLGSRTKRVPEMIKREIERIWDGEINSGKKIPEYDSTELSNRLVEHLGTKKDGKWKPLIKTNDKDNVMLFISHDQAYALARLAFDERINIESTEKSTELKKQFDEFRKECNDALNGHNSIDIALFGRMVADNPNLNRDAAAQVAHAISTHTIQNEYDYFTAVDDYSSEDSTGAAHIGTIEYNSATLYRYATVNLMELVESLGAKDTPQVARGFVEAFVRSMPTGKQNTFANRTLPDAVYVTIRRDQPVNLCGAFEKPVQAGVQGYATASAKELVKYANTVYTNYATEPVCAFAVGDLLENLAESMPLNELLDRVAEKVSQFLSESEGE